MAQAIALVVDDEEDIRTLMQMTLKRLDVESICVENVQQAKQALAERFFPGPGSVGCGAGHMRPRRLS